MLSGDLHIFSETKPNFRDGKGTLLTQKPCRGASSVYEPSFQLASMSGASICKDAVKHLFRASPSQAPSTSSCTCCLRIALCLSLCSSPTFSLPPQPGKWGVGTSQDPQFKIKSDLFLSPSLLPNNHTCVKLMLYITKREASLERVQSDNF